MKVGQGATTNSGVWMTFLVILALYIGVTTTLVLILRKMSRRFRAGDDTSDIGSPYGPREPVPVGAASTGGDE